MGNDDAGQTGQQPEIDLYARISYAITGDLIKTDDQIEMGREDVEARGGRVGRVFRDDSLSAWKPNVVRKDWELMMHRLESGASAGVWVLDLTRFSRKVREGERLVEAAQSGARVWSAAGEYNLQTADGRRHFREAMVAAAGESDKISERVKRGKVRRARKGKTPGVSAGTRCRAMSRNQTGGNPATPAPRFPRM
ncbi:recombinase family protein [Phytohabitans rumicis]|uniref:Resolvase/invertase-type recombinase catalytic domain-containing protein n=1 Tax=Phytohabitans rumicis TaxID=1076125 RepID=A0A6V8L1A7_9ACTN|nr:recombinase family protein [Phytohabitans rumicis]GFJ91063.1 hypothetical protein Prum_047050 [Phytohabitans rumicis]